jgi:hypothetical protein
LGKKVAKMGEDGKVAVRNVRKDILKKLDRWGVTWARERWFGRGVTDTEPLRARLGLVAGQQSV